MRTEQENTHSEPIPQRLTPFISILFKSTTKRKIHTEQESAHPRVLVDKRQLSANPPKEKLNQTNPPAANEKGERSSRADTPVDGFTNQINPLAANEKGAHTYRTRSDTPEPQWIIFERKKKKIHLAKKRNTHDKAKQ